MEQKSEQLPAPRHPQLVMLKACSIAGQHASTDAQATCNVQMHYNRLHLQSPSAANVHPCSEIRTVCLHDFRVIHEQGSCKHSLDSNAAFTSQGNGGIDQKHININIFELQVWDCSMTGAAEEGVLTSRTWGGAWRMKGRFRRTPATLGVLQVGPLSTSCRFRC